MIDEAHKFKNPSSTLTQSYHKFKENTVRFGLTGTAIQNDFNELWCLLDLLNPCSLGDGVRAWEILVAVSFAFAFEANIKAQLESTDFSSPLNLTGPHQERNEEQLYSFRT